MRLWLFLSLWILCLCWEGKGARFVRVRNVWCKMSSIANGVTNVNVRINRAIVDTFSNEFSESDLERLRLLIIESKKSLNQINVITLLHRCGKHKKPIFSFNEPQLLLNLLNSTQSTSQGIANVIYSLQGMDKRLVEIHVIIKIMTQQLLQSTEIFDGQASEASIEKFIWYVGHRNSHANFLMARCTRLPSKQHNAPIKKQHPLNRSTNVFLQSLYISKFHFLVRPWKNENPL